MSKHEKRILYSNLNMKVRIIRNLCIQQYLYCLIFVRDDLLSRISLVDFSPSLFADRIVYKTKIKSMIMHITKSYRRN